MLLCRAGEARQVDNTCRTMSAGSSRKMLARFTSEAAAHHTSAVAEKSTRVVSVRPVIGRFWFGWRLTARLWAADIRVHAGSVVLATRREG
jgi:hypothetical protein